ncbi:protein BIG GRAIN 1-like A [Telopea speciosissima]|uniref:protein BIG GRAIN 1-like A n=1 Tax=Telopea speciosissima TaxID=54955 RepID=UPI001CC6874C|nr:protein BIG GRAIN 1-like A [Telopea speciosissima]
MEMEKWEKSQREDRCRHARTNPSFSSTLLDAIYRSIDEGDDGGEEEMVLYRETMRKKQSSSVRGSSVLPQEEMVNLRRTDLIEQWMEKKVSEKVVVRRKSSVADFDFNPPKLPRDRNSVLFNSTSSSSDSSSGGGFSSSEAESVYGARSSSSGLKPVQTVVSVQSEKPPRYERQQRKSNDFDNHYQGRNNSVTQQKPKHEGGFIKTKSRALKIYGDLKKAKQPISPGGRLSNFLNSLFTAGYPKKAKISSSSSVGGGGDERESKSAQASTCSSASSFSRSCLSKTPSSRGKLSNGTKRSVRFYPVSVIFDEDCRPCGHKCLHEDEPNLMAVTAVRKIGEASSLNKELQFHLTEKNRRVEEAARDLLKGYQNKCYFNTRDLHVDDEDDEDDDDDDDAASYSSSDLFELDNLAAIGIDRYNEELPVYETTHLDTNRAIASGLIL